MGKRTVQTELLALSGIPEQIRELLAGSPDSTARIDGKIYLVSGQTVFSMEDTPEAEELIRVLKYTPAPPVETASAGQELLRRILTDQGFEPAPETLHRAGLSNPQSMCVILFHHADSQAKSLHSLFSELTPAEEGDIPVETDAQTVALIKNRAFRSDEEIEEFAMAVIGTLEDEGITGVSAGIGRDADSFTGLRESYQEAARAIELGRRYHPAGLVYRYGRQILERIIDAIPEKQRLAIRREYFGQNDEDRFDSEMRETVRVFFLNDLNLTAASKQLFIHRNTLNYRLDKIRKDFGLDLRSFPDAVIFRILTEIPEEEKK